MFDEKPNDSTFLYELADHDDRKLEKRLRLFVQNEEGSELAQRRAEYVIERITPDIERELVTNSVEYTYVRTPADYTRKKRNEKPE